MPLFWLNLIAFSSDGTLINAKGTRRRRRRNLKPFQRHIRFVFVVLFVQVPFHQVFVQVLSKRNKFGANGGFDGENGKKNECKLINCFPSVFFSSGPQDFDQQFNDVFGEVPPPRPLVIPLNPPLLRKQF